jgi:hypothetical protein
MTLIVSRPGHCRQILQSKNKIARNIAIMFKHSKEDCYAFLINNKLAKFYAILLPKQHSIT